MKLHSISCIVRTAAVYSAAAFVGIALAGDVGNIPVPAGLPDLSGVSWPAAAVLVAGLLRGQSFTVVLRDERVK